jgi:Polyketide cyclase / dehydrase and lipid transport
MADLERSFCASHLLSGSSQERIFAALLDVRRFPEWALGLRRARALDAASKTETSEVSTGTVLEFILSAAGLTHRVVSTVTVVEPPRRLEWRYAKGAKGSGGWLLEDAGSGTVRLTLSTDYEVRPAWLDRLAHRPFFRGITEDLLRRSMRRFERYLDDSR